MDLYAQNILDRYKEPFYKDKFTEGDIHHKEANHSCGDVVEINLKLTDGKVTDYSFTGNGCAISMASADIMGDMIEEMTEEEILKLNFKDIEEVLGIPISLRRSKCALLSLLTLQNGLLIKGGKDKKEWTDYTVNPKS